MSHSRCHMSVQANSKTMTQGISLDIDIGPLFQIWTFEYHFESSSAHSTSLRFGSNSSHFVSCNI